MSNSIWSIFYIHPTFAYDKIIKFETNWKENLPLKYVSKNVKTDRSAVFCNGLYGMMLSSTLFDSTNIDETTSSNILLEIWATSYIQRHTF